MATSGERFAAAASAASVSQLRGLNAWQRHQHFLRVRNDAYGRRQGAAAGSAERTEDGSREAAPRDVFLGIRPSACQL